LVQILEFLSSLFLGLLVGSLLLEAFVLVPIWKKMDPKLFLQQHPVNSPYIYNYFKPMTILGTAFPILASLLPFLFYGNFDFLKLTPGLVAFIMLIIYFVYFKTANLRFYNGSIEASDLSKELATWGLWHWGRTILGLVGFAASLLIMIRV